MRRKFLMSALLAVLAGGLVAAPAAEAHRLSGSKAKRALTRFVRSIAVDVDGSRTDTGDTLFVDSYSVGGRDLANGGCLRESRHKVWCVNAIEGTGQTSTGGNFDWFCIDGAVAWFRSHRSRRVRVRDDRDDPECELAMTAKGSQHRQGTPNELRAIERKLEDLQR